MIISSIRAWFAGTSSALIRLDIEHNKGLHGTLSRPNFSYARDNLNESFARRHIESIERAPRIGTIDGFVELLDAGEPVVLYFDLERLPPMRGSSIGLEINPRHRGAVSLNALTKNSKQEVLKVLGLEPLAYPHLDQEWRYEEETRLLVELRLALDALMNNATVAEVSARIARLHKLSQADAWETFKQALWQADNSIPYSKRLETFARGADIVIQSIYRVVHQEYPEMAEIALAAYGSYGKAEAGRYSDLDLFVLYREGHKAEPPAHLRAAIEAFGELFTDVFDFSNRVQHVVQDSLDANIHELPKGDADDYRRLLTRRFVTGNERLFIEAQKVFEQNLRENGMLVLRRLIQERNNGYVSSKNMWLLDPKQGLGRQPGMGLDPLDRRRLSRATTAGAARG